MNFYKIIGGRKHFSWLIVTIVSSISLFLEKLTGSEWVSITIASFGLLGALNITQKIMLNKNRSKK